MPSVLLVDDDEYFRKAVRMILEQQKILVAEAPNGRVAKDILAAGKFDVIISDIQMPHFNGLELLEWVKAYKETPVILITGFSQIVETQKAFELGAAAFLTKPFKDTDILEAINKILSPAPKPAANVNFDDLYCRVSIDDFVMGKQIPFAVSIRLSPSKYIKVAHKGENIDLEQIKAYKNKGINFLYVKKDEYAQLVGFNLKLAKTMKGIQAISPEKKRAFLKYTGEVVLEQAFVSGLSEGAFRAAKDFIETSLSVVSEDEDAFSLLMNLNTHSDYLYAHSLGVSAIAVMIARGMGWDSPANVFKISLAGMFHDIGKKEIGKEIVEKARHMLTAPERAQLETHPMRGKDILQTLRAMPGDIVLVAFQHHEDCLGHGYPRRLKPTEIHPFARLIFLTDLFCNYTIRGPNTEACSAEDAIAKIEMYHKDEVDGKMFEALKALRGAPNPATVAA
jgi:response regulator RpfG family c-di-GMP phosphodiesterase